jgi:putative membrane protein
MNRTVLLRNMFTNVWKNASRKARRSQPKICPRKLGKQVITFYTKSMKKLFRSMFITTLSVALLAYFIPEITAVNTVTLVLAGMVIGLLNLTIKPILKALFLPINLLTLGVFNWLINIGLLYLALWLVPGFMVGEISIWGWQLSQFWSLVMFSFALSLTNSLISSLL